MPIDKIFCSNEASGEDISSRHLEDENTQAASSISVPENSTYIPGSRSKPPGSVSEDELFKILAKEAADSGDDLIQRHVANLFKSQATRTSLLTDLGIETVYPPILSSATEHLCSTVPESNDSFLPRLELWTSSENYDEITFPLSPEDPMGHWPARLLHIPSMTSIRWEPGNCYKEHKEPKYAVLSYTWGRWEIPKSADLRHPALEVHGIDWEVPSISPNLFSVQDFKNVLLRVSEETGVNFIWVDIACINQNSSSEEKAREIGRQAKIFGGASFAFVWLLADKGAQDSLDELTRHFIRALELHLQQLETVYQKLDSAYRGWSRNHALPDHSSPTRHLGTELQQAAKVELEDDGDSINLIIRAASAIDALTMLPWFTSTWTLQEAFIKPTALLLNRSGDLMMSQNGNPFSLEDLLTYCRRMHQVFSLSAKPFSEDAKASFEAVITRRGLISKLETSGLRALANRDRLSLYSCARLRQAGDQNDWIYGIMQVWDFQLGRSAPGRQAEQEWSLEDLEIELGMRLVQEFPIESQLHVHTKEAEVSRRQAWRVSRGSATILHNLAFTPTGHLDGAVNRHSSTLSTSRVNHVTYGRFTGKLCAFDRLRLAWRSTSHLDDGNSRFDSQSPVRISLDSSGVLGETRLRVKYSLQEVPDSQQLELADTMSTFFRDLGWTVSVLLLGTVRQSHDSVETTTAVGLIVMACPDASIGRWEKRLGVCLWNVPEPVVEQVRSCREDVDILSGWSGWTQYTCLFG